MRIEYNGKKFELPDDMTDEEVAGVLKKNDSATWWDTISAIPGTTMGMLKQTVGGTLRNIAETDYESSIEAERGGALATSRRPEFKPNVAGVKAGSELYQEGQKQIEDVSPGEMTFWQRATLQGVSSAAVQVPALAASVVGKTPVPALAAAGAMAYGSTYGESREKGSDPTSATIHGGIDAATEAVMELLPAKFLVDNAGGPVLRLIAGTMLREVPTEVATTAIQSANARLRDRELTGKLIDWREYGQDLLDTVGSTMVSAPLLAGTAGVIRRAEQALTPAEAPAQVEPTGSITPDNAPQQFDEPTPPITSQARNQIDALIESIDAELIDDKQVEAAQAVVKQYEKERKAPPSPQAEASWAAVLSAPRGEQDIGEVQLGATRKQAANAPNYVNPNQGDRFDRTFLYGPEGTIGLTPRQVQMKPATYTLGEPSADRDADYLKAVHETVEQWRQKYIPDSTIVVSNEGLFNNAALGWHYSLGDKQHLIIPAALRSPSKGLGAFNVNTQASAFFNLGHEFGHAMILDRFYSGMTQALQVQNESKLGTISEALAKTLPAEQQAVVKEFNAIKQQILDGTLSAQQFVDKWFSPGKLGQKNLLKELGVAPDDNAMAVVKAIVRHATRKANVNEPVKLKTLRDRLTQDFLSLDEYLAEQMTRYAYKTKMDESSPLGKFFKDALASLRNFFSGLKRDGMIAPGTAFTEWMEGLNKSDRGLTEGDRVASGKKKGGKPKAKGVDAAETAVAVVKGKPKAAPKKKVAKVQHNVETDTDVEMQARMSGMLDTLVKAGAIPEQAAARLQKYIDTKDYDHFIDEFQKYAAKNVKFQLDEVPESDRSVFELMSVLRAGMSLEHVNDPATRAAAMRAWQEKGFRSPFFKAWFGDWENDPANASKIRKGAGIVMPGTMNAVIVDTDERIHAGSAPFGGEPLVVFHSTTGAKPGISFKKGRQAFDRFERGDLGFHLGTVRAAHIRAGFEASLDPYLATDETMEVISKNMKEGVARQLGTYVIPAVLNIRNPLYIGDEETHIWPDPKGMAYFLSGADFITIDERNQLLRAIDQWTVSLRDLYGQAVGLGYKTYEWFQPVRELLMSKGYDGMIYRNVVEGDISFVAFHPNQIKSLLGSRTFSQSDLMHMELDLDGAKEGSWGLRRMWDGLKNFTGDFPRLRRATRQIQHAAYHVLELQQLSHLNPDLEELSFMNEKNGEYNRYKARLQAKADAVLGEWNKLGKENWTKFNKFLLAELEGKQLWFDLKKTQINREGRPAVWYEYVPNALTAQKAQEFGLDEELTDLALKVKNVLLDQLNETEYALLSLLGKRYANADAKVLTAALIPVKRHIQQLRKEPFFPQGRFGNRVLIVEKEKTSGPGYEIVWREHFENPIEWEKAWKDAVNRAAPDERVRKEELTDQSYVLMALPTDFVDLAASELGLSDEQLEILMNILQPVKRERVLSAYDQERLKIKGYSTDAMRSFANFTWHNANMLAKLIYRADFNWAIRGVGSRLREAKYATDDESLRNVERFQRVKSFMEKTRDYVMAPPNEAQMLRAVVSIGYLGLNVKTALLNTFGLMTTWSDLTTRFGQIEGNKLFLQATKDTFASLKLTSLNERRAGEYLSPDKQKALDQAIEEGVLSQSYAYHLAGMANAGNLYRLPARQAVGRVAQHTIDAAMYLFRLTELSTRRASFLAEFEAARKKPELSLEDAYQEAVARTNKLQNDYSLGNRPPFMRGVKAGNENIVGKIFEPIVPLATVFMTFAQHMGFHSYGGYELGERRMAKHLGETPRKVFGGYTMKLWIITLLLAGYEGLPGAENLLDLLEIAWRKWGGGKPIRQELREMVQTLEVDPQLAAHGFGHNMAGFDVSRSIGFGRMVPGTDSLAHNAPNDSVAKMVGTLALDLAGPTGGFIKFGLEAIAGNKPRAEAFEKLPGGAGNIYTGYRWSQQGVRAPTGSQITFDLETGQLRDLTAAEIAGKIFGFNPTIVSQNRQIRFDQYDRKVYWQERRGGVMDDLWRARWQKDREAEADAKKAIVEYNASVPAEFKELRITGADVIKSLQARQRIKALEEKQLAPQRRYRGLYEDVKQSYDQP